jgi:hypothetical protein
MWQFFLIYLKFIMCFLQCANFVVSIKNLYNKAVLQKNGQIFLANSNIY